MPTELAEAKKRASDLEKIVKNFTLEMNTVKILVGHAISDLEHGDDAHIEAAKSLCLTIRDTAEMYR